MINLKSYVVLTEELDADNLMWKYDNWASSLDDDAKANLDVFMSSQDASASDIKDFKRMIDATGIDFTALIDVVNDDTDGMPDNFENIYVLKKIMDTIKCLSKKKKEMV